MFQAQAYLQTTIRDMNGLMYEDRMMSASYPAVFCPYACPDGVWWCVSVTNPFILWRMSPC
jgi:hypothetical protein